jgi:hypothetical protein
VPELLGRKLGQSPNFGVNSNATDTVTGMYSEKFDAQDMVKPAVGILCTKPRILAYKITTVEV